MAYQNVDIPRFYIDSGLYQQAIGVYAPDPDQVSLVQLNPSNIVNRPINFINVPRTSPIRYLAILGHNGGTMYPEWLNNDNSYGGTADLTEIINAQPYASNTEVEHEGYSIWTFNDNESWENLRAVLGNNVTAVGAVSIGNYWEAPFAPDLNLKLSYEYDGIKNITTKGGATLSNASYTKPADWGDGYGAWQLGRNPNMRSGRRVWDLSFSFLSDTDVFPVNANTSYAAYTSDGYHTDTNNPTTGFEDIDTTSSTGGTAGLFTSNILDGQDFFSVVWNKTMAGHLPFIFQPDKDNNNEFAICRFDQKSLQMTPVSPNIYKMKVKIKESW